MPPTSEQLPLLGIYYAVTTCIVSLSTAMTVFTLNINNKGRRGQEVPKLVRVIFFDYIARFMRIKLESVSSMRLLNRRLLNERLSITPYLINKDEFSVKGYSGTNCKKHFEEEQFLKSDSESKLIKIFCLNFKIAFSISQRP